MEQISKEFDSMSFLKQLYEIDKKIIERYEELKEELRQGASLEELDLLKLKLLFIEEKSLLKQAPNKNINELWFMVIMEEIPENIQELFGFDCDKGFEFDLECPIDKSVKSRMDKILSEIKDRLSGKYIIYNNKIQIPRTGMHAAIEFIEAFLAAEKQISILQQSVKLDDEIAKQLYIYLNISYLNILSSYSIFETIMICNRNKVNIDEEFIEFIKSIKKDLYEKDEALLNEISAKGVLLAINSLAAMELGLDDTRVLFNYIWQWAIMEIQLEKCNLAYLEYFIEYVEKIEFFADERIKDEIFVLLNNKKKKLR